MSSPPTSPTGAERRASIKKKHDDQMHKKLLEQKALNQKRKMERKRQEIENKRLAELENARDGLISAFKHEDIHITVNSVKELTEAEMNITNI